MAERDGRPPPGVEKRLERLRSIYLPERDVDARRRLESEAEASAEPFAVGVARRLADLRALSDLASYLHRGRQGR